MLDLMDLYFFDDALLSVVAVGAYMLDGTH